MNKREGGRHVPYEHHLSLQGLGRASILSSLIGPAKKTKVQKTSYSIEISSNIDPSTIDKLIWNKYKFERNRPSIDCINENKVLLTAMDVVQQLHQYLLVHTLAKITHIQDVGASNDISPMRS
jgi:hypothetical protein